MKLSVNKTGTPQALAKRLIFVCYVILIFFTACKESEDKQITNKVRQSSLADLPTAVKVMQIKVKSFNRELLANGKLVAIKKADIKFANDGIIKQIYIKEGDQIHTGQVLARIDDLQLQRTFLQDKLRYQQALLDYNDHLLRMGYQLADTLRINKEVKQIARLRSGLAGTEIEYERSKTNLENTILRAPFSGKIANLKSSVFALTSASENFCTLIDDSNCWVDFLILEQELSYILSNKTISISPFNNNTEVYTGGIESINPLVEKSGMIRVRARIQNFNRKLLDGMSVNVTVRHPIDKQLVIPKAALLDRQGRKVVFTKKANLAKWNYVEVAFENSKEFAIKKGLKAGDSVIYEGNFDLAHDKKVLISNY